MPLLLAQNEMPSLHDSTPASASKCKYPATKEAAEIVARVDAVVAQAEEDANQTTTKAAHNKRHFSSFLLHTPAVKLEADFNPSMLSGLLAREAGAAEQSGLRKALIARSPMCAVIDLTTLRERKTTSERACASNVSLEQ